MSDACTAGTILFRNDEWSVSGEGLEHHRTGYFIGRDVLGARRSEGLWDWPLQMAEKRWCRPSLFREAFLAALDRFGFERDSGLSESFAIGFGIRAGQGSADPGFMALGDLLRGPSAPAGRNRPTPDRRNRVAAGA